jgi:hypothetical protein
MSTLPHFGQKKSCGLVLGLVTLAHIKRQSRLSLGSYGKPWVTEELKEIGLEVGHQLHLGP